MNYERIGVMRETHLAQTRTSLLFTSRFSILSTLLLTLLSEVAHLLVRRPPFFLAAYITVKNTVALRTRERTGLGANIALFHTFLTAG